MADIIERADAQNLITSLETLPLISNLVFWQTFTCTVSTLFVKSTGNLKYTLFKIIASDFASSANFFALIMNCYL